MFCVYLKPRYLCTCLALITTWGQSYIWRYYHVVLRESKTSLFCSVLEIKLLLSSYEENATLPSLLQKIHVIRSITELTFSHLELHITVSSWFCLWKYAFKLTFTLLMRKSFILLQWAVTEHTFIVLKEDELFVMNKKRRYSNIRAVHFV